MSRALSNHIWSSGICGASLALCLKAGTTLPSRLNGRVGLDGRVSWEYLFIMTADLLQRVHRVHVLLIQGEKYRRETLHS